MVIGLVSQLLSICLVSWNAITALMWDKNEIEQQIANENRFWNVQAIAAIVLWL